MFHNWKGISYIQIYLWGHEGIEKLGVGDHFAIVKHNLLLRKKLFSHTFFNFLSKSLQIDSRKEMQQQSHLFWWSKSIFGKLESG